MLSWHLNLEDDPCQAGSLNRLQVAAKQFPALFAGFAAAGSSSAGVAFKSNSAQLAQAIETGRLSLEDFINQVQSCTLIPLCIKFGSPPMHTAWALSKLTSRFRNCLAVGCIL